MVCADVLHRQGMPVRLTIEGNAAPDSLGRSFRPVLVRGVRVELGARLLELDYGDRLPDPGISPRRYVFGQHRLHMPLIRAYVTSLIDPQPVMLLLERNGVRGSDFLLSSNLHYLREICTERERVAIRNEARSACAVMGRGGLTRAQLQAMTYRDASQTLHGETFHRAFIRPLVDAILGRLGDIAALDHRRIWLPLFSPGEVWDAADGVSRRPLRWMCSGMGAAVDALARRVEPLIDRALPATAARTSVVREHSQNRPSVTLPLQFHFRPDVTPDRMTWHLDEGPVFRSTTIRGVRCSESRQGEGFDIAAQRDGIGGVAVQVPIGDGGVIDPRGGWIGVGNFNEQVMQGISAAAWRMQ